MACSSVLLIFLFTPGRGSLEVPLMDLCLGHVPSSFDAFPGLGSAAADFLSWPCVEALSQLGLLSARSPRPG